MGQNTHMGQNIGNTVTLPFQLAMILTKDISAATLWYAFIPSVTTSKMICNCTASTNWFNTTLNLPANEVT